jgi:dolichyl-phosphate beta-glucosyltransferase
MPARLLLVVPCYNEGSRLEQQPFLRLVGSNRDVALLFVDDGSSDATAAMLADLVSGGGTRITVLTLPRNMGKAEAVRRGVQASLEQQPEYVGYWDADLSTPLSALQGFIDTLDVNPDIDIVMGSRVKMLGRQIERRLFRHYTGRLFATAASLALGLAVYDTQCGAKVFRVTDTTRRAFGEPFRSQWVMDVEILARYVRARGPGAASSICEIPLQEWRDVPGSRFRLLHAPRALMDVIGIGRQLRGKQSGLRAKG